MNLIKVVFILILLPLTACIQADNSSSLDEDLYGGASDGTPAFLAARSVFRTSCSSPCHDYGTKTEGQLKAAGLFFPGDADSSPLYNSLSTSTAPTGRKDMPQNGSLSADDTAIIKTWIETATP
jgi:hypothetical protein